MNATPSIAWLAGPHADGEQAWLARRAQEEWRAATAAYPAARQAHVRLAQLYEERARARPHTNI